MGDLDIADAERYIEFLDILGAAPRWVANDDILLDVAHNIYVVILVHIYTLFLLKKSIYLEIIFNYIIVCGI